MALTLVARVKSSRPKKEKLALDKLKRSKCTKVNKQNSLVVKLLQTFYATS